MSRTSIWVAWAVTIVTGCATGATRPTDAGGPDGAALGVDGGIDGSAPMFDAGPTMPGVDAGPMMPGMDAGPTMGVDAGPTMGVDAGPTMGVDAGPMTGPDAGALSSELALPDPSGTPCTSPGSLSECPGIEVCRFFSPAEGRCETCGPCGNLNDPCSASDECDILFMCFRGRCTNFCTLGTFECGAIEDCVDIGHPTRGVCVPF